MEMRADSHALGSDVAVWHKTEKGATARLKRRVMVVRGQFESYLARYLEG
jgi:hypothetical protein